MRKEYSIVHADCDTQVFTMITKEKRYAISRYRKTTQ